jgi:hypothetical protein
MKRIFVGSTKDFLRNRKQTMITWKSRCRKPGTGVTIPIFPAILTNKKKPLHLPKM